MKTAVELSEALSVLGEHARALLESPHTDLYYTRNACINFEAELIQVAASAIAALIDWRMAGGDCEPVDRLHARIEEEIRLERVRQDANFGQMPRYLDPLIWIAIVVEELAEAAEEVIVVEE